jgi:hypothetical protein
MRARLDRNNLNIKSSINVKQGGMALYGQDN